MKRLLEGRYGFMVLKDGEEAVIVEIEGRVVEVGWVKQHLHL